MLLAAHSHFDPKKRDLNPNDLETAIHIGLGLDYTYHGIADGHSTYAQNITAAMGEYKLALTLEPSSPLANLFYAYNLRKAGRREEALA